MGAVKTSFNKSEGIKVEYVDPANMVYSYTESPYFDDIYYVGEVKTIPVNELKKQFPNLSKEELVKITGQGFQNSGFYNRSLTESNQNDKNQIQVFIL